MATGIYGGPCTEKHTAMIFDRGGQKRIGPLLDLSYVQWERARDNVSEATVRVEGDACNEQAEFIASLRTHRHEIVIFRGDERVFEGPLHRIASHRSFTEIVAKDVSEYLFHTPMTQRYNNSNVNGGTGPVPVTTRIANIIDHEMTTNRTQQVYNWTTGLWENRTVIAWENLDPPTNVLPYLVIHHWPNEAETTADTVPFQMTVGEHLANLAAQSGIDWTTVGRSIHIWDVSRSLGRLPQWTEANFYADVVVTEYGSDHSQAAYVIGSDGVYGQALNEDWLSYYGPWTDIYTAYNEEGTAAPSEPALRSQAQRNLSGRSPSPVEVRIPDNSGLILSDTLTISMLVPGVQVPLLARLNARPLSQMQKIDHVKVTEDSSGETVQIILTPTTRADSDEEEEED